MEINKLAAALLDCGYADISFIENHEQEHDLDINDAIEICRENENLNANGLIYELQRQFIQKIEKEFDISLEEEKHYTTFQNCLDSHIWCKSDGDVILDEFGKRKGQKIIDAINKW